MDTPVEKIEGAEKDKPDSRIGVVVVMYNPDIVTARRWKDFAYSNPDICFIFVDNTPCASIIPEVRSIIESTPHHLLFNENMGIATAQNRGWEALEDLGCSHIIFFDQDSKPTSTLIHGLSQTFLRESANRKVGAVGPRVLNSSAIDEKYREGIEIADKIISSGTLTSTEVLHDVGGMEEKLFIDAVDHEWCWRAESKGYLILRDNSLHLPHKIGKANVKCWGKQLHLTAPVRYFYIYRNSRRMLPRRYVPLRWKLHIIRMLIRHLLLIPFAEDFKGQKAASMSYAIRGLFAK